MKIKLPQLPRWALLIGLLGFLMFSHTSALAGGPPEGESLVGNEWKWVQSLYGNDQKSVPADPTHYTIMFKPDGTLSVRADCNHAGGTYTVKGQTLAIQVTHSTMAMCPSDSLDAKFLKDLDAAAIYFFKNGYLLLDLKYDTGTMTFKP
jgi:heat shock protein HslJ